MEIGSGRFGRTWIFRLKIKDFNSSNDSIMNIDFHQGDSESISHSVPVCSLCKLITCFIFYLNFILFHGTTKYIFWDRFTHHVRDIAMLLSTGYLVMATFADYYG